MKRYVILIGVVLTFLLVGWAAFGQEEEKPRQRSINRQSLLNMSPEQRRQFQAQMRQRRGSSNFRTDQGEQLKAIEAIQEQLVKYKTALQNVNREALLNYEKLSEEEKTKLTQTMTKSAYERKQALAIIEEKLPVIRGTQRRPGTEPLMPIPELKSIHQLAIREKAKQTAERLDRMIKRYDRESTSSGKSVPRQIPQNRSGNEKPARP